MPKLVEIKISSNFEGLDNKILINEPINVKGDPGTPPPPKKEIF